MSPGSGITKSYLEDQAEKINIGLESLCIKESIRLEFNTSLQLIWDISLCACNGFVHILDDELELVKVLRYFYSDLAPRSANMGDDRTAQGTPVI
ncbi:hypothetical protein ANO14919_137460 [Xylariales sp. No.14919]|nr:hypothetical protein ANO14919_137460 [Xylariales sp. No.14919]